MARAIEFILNHWMLVSLFVGLLAALIALEIRRSGQGLTPQKAVQLINHDGAVVVDVRDNKDYSEGHIVDSVHLPYSQVSERMSELERYKDKPVIVVCKMGQASGAVVRQLTQAGFADVRRLSGGISAWQSERFPLVKS